ncbi:hypothetical protein GCM10022388_11910 [Flavobacterium chungnamense]|jgi:hypothetical protein|uniref:Uncharacterized protein n=1 Tax=Flavobacterium chungnamense TaxID=706182 RepID=A0ABP7UNI4_9FLAO
MENIESNPTIISLDRKLKLSPILSVIVKKQTTREKTIKTFMTHFSFLTKYRVNLFFFLIGKNAKLKKRKRLFIEDNILSFII